MELVHLESHSLLPPSVFVQQVHDELVFRVQPLGIGPGDLLETQESLPLQKHLQQLGPVGNAIAFRESFPPSQQFTAGRANTSNRQDKEHTSVFLCH